MGLQATLIDLFEYEAEQESRISVEDVHEVCSYLDAIKCARGQIKSARGLPHWKLLSAPTHPALSISAGAKLLKTTKPTAGKAVQEKLGMLAETTGKLRDRAYAYAGYLEKLPAGTEAEAR